MVLGGRQEEDSGRGRGKGKATKLVTRGAKGGREGGRDGVRLYHADRAGGTTLCCARAQSGANVQVVWTTGKKSYVQK